MGRRTCCGYLVQQGWKDGRDKGLEERQWYYIKWQEKKKKKKKKKKQKKEDCNKGDESFVLFFSYVRSFNLKKKILFVMKPKAYHLFD